MLESRQLELIQRCCKACNKVKLSRVGYEHLAAGGITSFVADRLLKERYVVFPSGIAVKLILSNSM
jgi:hypothetical protein